MQKSGWAGTRSHCRDWIYGKYHILNDCRAGVPSRTVVTAPHSIHLWDAYWNLCLTSMRLLEKLYLHPCELWCSDWRTTYSVLPGIWWQEHCTFVYSAMPCTSIHSLCWSWDVDISDDGHEIQLSVSVISWNRNSSGLNVININMQCEMLHLFSHRVVTGIVSFASSVNCPALLVFWHVFSVSKIIITTLIALGKCHGLVPRDKHPCIPQQLTSVRDIFPKAHLKQSKKIYKSPSTISLENSDQQEQHYPGAIWSNI